MAELKRALGFWTILALAVANIMGTGMFFGASVAASYSGNASIVAWAALTLIAVYISTFFGELVAMFPSAGGVYEYSKQAYTRFISFMMGWLAWLVGNISVALLVLAAVNYIIPATDEPYLKLAICALMVIALNLVAFFGIEASGFILILLAGTSIGIVLSVVFPGSQYMDINNLKPLFTHGYLPIFVTIFFIAENFFGWEGSTYLAEETKNPEKIIPLALIIGTVIVGILSVSVSIVSLGVFPWQELAKLNAPLSAVFGVMFGESSTMIINIGVFVALIGSAAGGVVGLPRLILALARDKLFIEQLSHVHHKFNTPYKAIIFQTVVSLIVLVIASGNYKLLLSLLLPMGMVMYIFTIFSVAVLRLKKPHIERSFKVPFAYLGSVLIILFLISLVVAWSFTEPEALKIILLGGSFITIGIPIYLLLTFYYNPDAIVQVNNTLAYLTLFTERFILPKSVRKEIIKLLGYIQNKTILEFGCSVGTLTLELAEHVKPNGRVFATDLSERDLLITKKRLIKKGHMHVTVIYDQHQINRVHPDIPQVDSIVSIGMMGYLQDVKKVLREMRELIPYGGRIVFVDYVDFFKFIPNVDWLSSDKKIANMFSECGFSVYVERKKGLLWNYVFVYGMKYHHNVPYI